MRRMGILYWRLRITAAAWPEEEMSRILSEDAKEGKGYGVRNIHTRIRLVYGEGYGLEYRKSEWGGVSVRLRFPKGRRDMG